MNNIVKGALLGITLIIANKFCCLIFTALSGYIIYYLSGIVFLLIITAFLISESHTSLFIKGFTGLFVMFSTEIIGLIAFGRYLPIDPILILMVYIGGLFGSFPAIFIADILTFKKISLSDILNKKGAIMNYKTDNKYRLLLYAVISAMTFSYLILPENAGISVPIFTLIQFVFLWFIIPNRKKLVIFIPIFMLSLNNFLSAGDIWHNANFFVITLLYISVFTDFSFKTDNLHFINELFTNAVTPISRVHLPFKWTIELTGSKASLLKRILIAIAITVPCAAIVVALLSSADMVFSMKTNNLIDDIFKSFRLNTVSNILCGILVGLYLFGLALSAYSQTTASVPEKAQRNGDVLIISIILSVMLFIYTSFVIIQFKYLFAGATLPDGLSYTQYARKGFFELLALTGINTAAILSVTALTKNHPKCIFTKILCHYLCVITVILLVSSFYRMYLYTNDDGLTRLRFFVMGFLIFESIGLVITFAYIAKPKFNIALVYTVIALTYYSILNIIPVDNIIAKNQIDKYLNGERNDISYVYTLSADAAPALNSLYKDTSDTNEKENITDFLERETKSDIPQRWQRYNLSSDRAYHILQTLK